MGGAHHRAADARLRAGKGARLRIHRPERVTDRGRAEWTNDHPVVRGRAHRLLADSALGHVLLWDALNAARNFVFGGGRIVMRGGAAVARRAHNPKAGRSNRPPATVAADYAARGL